MKTLFLYICTIKKNILFLSMWDNVYVVYSLQGLVSQYNLFFYPNFHYPNIQFYDLISTLNETITKGGKLI